MNNSNLKELNENEMRAVNGGTKWIKYLFEFIGRAYGEMNALQQKYDDNGMWLH